MRFMQAVLLQLGLCPEQLRSIILATEAENGLCREVVEATGLKPVVPT